MAVIKEEAARKMLGDVPQNKQFYCNDGQVINNLAQLAVALAKMSPATFEYHSRGGKTDFSNWLRDVIGDEKLARDLIKAGQARAVKVVKDRVVWLEGKIHKPEEIIERNSP